MTEDKNIYAPIRQKITSWIEYIEGEPKSNYYENPRLHDEYRRKHDLDCKLNNGNLYADTVINLWLALRFALVNINGYTINGQRPNKDAKFLNFLLEDENLETYLPQNRPTTQLLSKLFELGQGIENTMILPDRNLQRRGGPPYFDYMPYFLFECFKGGDFAGAFKSDNELKDWILKEHLQMFFKDNIISQENILDLAGTENIKNNVPQDINLLLNNYIQILNARKKYFV